MWGRGAAPGSLLFQNFPFPSITRQGQGLLIEPGCRGRVSRVYAPGLYLIAKLLRMCPASAAPSPPRQAATFGVQRQKQLPVMDKSKLCPQGGHEVSLPCLESLPPGGSAGCLGSFWV